MSRDSVLTVDVDFTPLLRYLDDQERNQIPFASAVTLTRLAIKGRDTVRGGLSSRFTLRTPWLPRGIRYTPAEKRDWPNQQAEVGSKDAFMRAQELGGRKVPKNGGTVAEPLAIRPTIEARTPPSKWPGALLRKRRTFTNRLSSGPRAGHRAVLRRVGPERFPLQVLYVFEKFTPIKPRLGMRKTVTDVVRDNLETVWTAEMQKATRPPPSARADTRAEISSFLDLAIARLNARPSLR